MPSTPGWPEAGDAHPVGGRIGGCGGALHRVPGPHAGGRGAARRGGGWTGHSGGTGWTLPGEPPLTYGEVFVVEPGRNGRARVTERRMVPVSA
jgi:hypothetical protein